MSELSIVGLDKAVVLLALYNAVQTLGRGVLIESAPATGQRSPVRRSAPASKQRKQ